MHAIGHLSGRKIAVVIVDYSEKEDGDWYVISGRAKIIGDQLFIDQGMEADFPIPGDTYDRIKEVNADSASIVGDAEFVTTLTVGRKPDGVAGYIPTGLRLPKSEEGAQ